MHAFCIHDIEIEDYLADRSYVSSSALRHILRSTAHLQRYLNKREESLPHLDLGSAIHCAILEPERFTREYVSLPVAHTDIFHPADLALIQHEQAPVRFLTESQMRIVEGIRNRLEQLDEVKKLLHSGVAERSLFWLDEATGLRCKIRPDLLVLPHLIVELKTTFDASLAVFQRTLQMQYYHLSAAMYRAGVHAVTGHHPSYVFLVMSRVPPYDIETFVPSEKILRLGEVSFRTALDKLKADKRLAQSYLAAVQSSNDD